MRQAPDPRDLGEEYINFKHGGSVPKRPTTHGTFNELDAVKVPQTQPGHPRDPVVHLGAHHSNTKEATQIGADDDDHFHRDHHFQPPHSNVRHGDHGAAGNSQHGDYNAEPGHHAQDPHEYIKQLQEQLANARAEAAHHAKEAETHKAALAYHRAHYASGHPPAGHHPQGHGHADHHLQHHGPTAGHPQNHVLSDSDNDSAIGDEEWSDELDTHHLRHQGPTAGHLQSHGPADSDNDSAIGDDEWPDEHDAHRPPHHLGPQHPSGTHSPTHPAAHGQNPAHLMARLERLKHETALLKEKLKKQEIEANHWHHEADKLKEQLFHEHSHDHEHNHGHGYG